MSKGYPGESSNPAGPFSQTATCPLLFSLACQRNCFGYLLLSCGPSEQEEHLLCHAFSGSPACSSILLHLQPASVLSKQCLVGGIPGGLLSSPLGPYYPSWKDARARRSQEGKIATLNMVSFLVSLGTESGAKAQ